MAQKHLSERGKNSQKVVLGIMTVCLALSVSACGRRGSLEPVEPRTLAESIEQSGPSTVPAHETP